MSDDSALTAIEPISIDVEVGDRSINVSPIRVGRLPAFVRAVEPLVPRLEALIVCIAETGVVRRAELLELLQESDSFIDAVCVGAGVERAWIDEQTLDVLVSLAAAVVQVNSDFFARALVPVAVATFERVAPLATGTTSSPDSSEQGSPGATSST